MLRAATSELRSGKLRCQSYSTPLRMRTCYIASDNPWRDRSMQLLQACSLRL